MHDVINMPQPFKSLFSLIIFLRAFNTKNKYFVCLSIRFFFQFLNYFLALLLCKPNFLSVFRMGDPPERNLFQLDFREKKFFILIFCFRQINVYDLQE